jgi:hypothetical protein
MSMSHMQPVVICTSGYYSFLFLSPLQLDLAFLLRPFLRWGHEYMVPQGSDRPTTVGSKTWPSADKALLRGGVLFTVATVNVCPVLLSLPIVSQCALNDTDKLLPFSCFVTAIREQNSEVRIFDSLFIYLFKENNNYNNNNDNAIQYNTIFLVVTMFVTRSDP